MNFAMALEKKFKLEIPDTDYLQLATLNSCVAYFKLKLDASGITNSANPTTPTIPA